MEETRDLLALHNMTADNLRGALKPVRQPKEFSKFGNGALQQLVSGGRRTGNWPASMQNGKNDWQYWTTYIQDKNNTVWKATLNVAESANGCEVSV